MSMHTMHRDNLTRQSHRHRGAFTLVELLVVIFHSGDSAGDDDHLHQFRALN